MNDNKPIDWPDLKMVAHIKGRIATEEDLKAGHAVFVLNPQDEKINAKPLDIKIPQYALHINRKTGEEIPGIVIQAEEVDQGPKVIGFLPVGSRSFLAALLHEFKLLGTRKPSKKRVKKTS